MISEEIKRYLVKVCAILNSQNVESKYRQVYWCILFTWIANVFLFR
jgi:hypothetical protein